MYDVPHSTSWNDSIQVSRLLVLCEGLFNMNNSTLALVNNADSSVDYNVFLTVNGRGLGDTANDMKRYGGKVYITVNVSSQLEVIDANTFISIKQVPLFNDKGVARQPRNVVFYQDKVLVSCFDGFVAVLDTAVLEVEKLIQCGRNPDQMVISNGKLYVSNSGGLDFPFYDNTVSVVDLSSYKEIKQIEVTELHEHGQVNRAVRNDHRQNDGAHHKAVALELLSALRSRRILTPNPDEIDDRTPDRLVNSVRNERRRELCFEDHRWFDLRRWGMPEIKHLWKGDNSDATVTTYTLRKNDPMYTLQIPACVMLKNDKLIQNDAGGPRND